MIISVILQVLGGVEGEMVVVVVVVVVGGGGGQVLMARTHECKV